MQGFSHNSIEKETYLHLSVNYNNSVNIMRMLVEADATYLEQANFFKKTPLDLAVKKANLAAIELFKTSAIKFTHDELLVRANNLLKARTDINCELKAISSTSVTYILQLPLHISTKETENIADILRTFGLSIKIPTKNYLHPEILTIPKIIKISNTLDEMIQKLSQLKDIYPSFQF